MVIFASICDDTGRSVHYPLQLVNNFVSRTSEEAGAIINSTGDECMHQCRGTDLIK